MTLQPLPSGFISMSSLLIDENLEEDGVRYREMKMWRKMEMARNMHDMGGKWRDRREVEEGGGRKRRGGDEEGIGDWRKMEMLKVHKHEIILNFFLT
jgi:hypothetical protein